MRMASAAEEATSLLLVLRCRPMEAWARAGASLVPSPQKRIIGVLWRGC
jgi:hypothetical protein